MCDRECSVFLGVQRALLGAVFPKLRVVAVDFTETSILVLCFVDGELSDEDKDSIYEIETEIMAQFPSNHQIECRVISLTFPEMVPKDMRRAYSRREV